MDFPRRCVLSRLVQTPTPTPLRSIVEFDGDSSCDLVFASFLSFLAFSPSRERTSSFPPSLLYVVTYIGLIETFLFWTGRGYRKIVPNRTSQRRCQTRSPFLTTPGRQERRARWWTRGTRGTRWTRRAWRRTRRARWGSWWSWRWRRQGEKRRGRRAGGGEEEEGGRA